MPGVSYDLYANLIRNMKLVKHRVYDAVEGAFCLRRNAAKGGKKNAGWKTVRTTHEIATILYHVSMLH